MAHGLVGGMADFTGLVIGGMVLMVALLDPFLMFTVDTIVPITQAIDPVIIVPLIILGIVQWLIIVPIVQVMDTEW